MSDNLTPKKFHLYSIKFTPYANKVGETSSNGIFRDVLNYVTRQKQAGKGHLIDKNRERANEPRRELFMTSMVHMPKERRIRCAIALLRSGKKPLIKPEDKFKLIPIPGGGSIAEETVFFIDLSKDKAIVCIEFNHHGPRMTDVEYYLRNIARDTIKMARTTTVEMYMERSIKDTLSSFKNVLNMEFKVRPTNLAKMDQNVVNQYFSQMNSLGHYLRPKFLKVEALFQI